MEANISQVISTLIEAIEAKRGEQGRSEAARELSIAITHLEDAQMRVNRAGSLIKDGAITVSNRL